MRILLVEDDIMLGRTVKEAIEQEHYVVDLVGDAMMCEAAIATTNFDLILLDINLPDKSGIEILKNLRKNKNNIPVIILTARDSINQKIEGLNSGADDYLVKPFDLEELLARINALARRSKGISSPTLIYGKLELNPFSHKFTNNKVEIDLSPMEFAIMKSLMENIGKVLSKDSLENILYSWNESIESNTIEVHIHHLRKKIDKNIIKTIRGVGYIIEEGNV
jgi:DNA-binding response OmpR family regulator